MPRKCLFPRWISHRSGISPPLSPSPTACLGACGTAANLLTGGALVKMSATCQDSDNVDDTVNYMLAALMDRHGMHLGMNA